MLIQTWVNYIATNQCKKKSLQKLPQANAHTNTNTHTHTHTYKGFNLIYSRLQPPAPTNICDTPGPRPGTSSHRDTIRSPEIDAQGLGSQHRRQAPGIARIVCQHVVTLKACSLFAAKLRKALVIQGFQMALKNWIKLRRDERVRPPLFLRFHWLPSCEEDCRIIRHFITEL